MTTATDVMDAMMEYFMAKSEHDSARESYDGYSWDYYGQGEIQDLEKACGNAAKVLDEFVNQAVKAALTEAGEA